MSRACSTCRLWANQRCQFLDRTTAPTFRCAAWRPAHDKRRLTAAAVRQIRAAYGSQSARELARPYGVSHTSIIRAAHEYTYKRGRR